MITARAGPGAFHPPRLPRPCARAPSARIIVTRAPVAEPITGPEGRTSMKAIPLILALALAARPARAQDNLDAAIRGLADKLAKDGISGRLAEAAGTDAGVQAIEEKIEFLLSSRVARLERDASGCFEDYLFAPDANGDLHLRPERQ